MYRKTTQGVCITVHPLFLAEGSKPEEGFYLWAYHVRIENKRLQSIQLRKRHWQIVDKSGSIQDIQGVGVVGEQPKLKPGEIYEYASGATLTTPSGLMMGSYYMESEGENLIIDIPAFSLDSPYEKATLH